MVQFKKLTVSGASLALTKLKLIMLARGQRTIHPQVKFDFVAVS